MGIRESVCNQFVCLFCYFALSPISRALAAIFIEGAHVLSLFLGGITKISYTRILFAARALFKVKHTSIWAAKRKLGSFQRKERTLLIFFFLFSFDRLFLSCFVSFARCCCCCFFFWFLRSCMIRIFFFMRESNAFWIYFNTHYSFMGINCCWKHYSISLLKYCIQCFLDFVFHSFTVFFFVQALFFW